MWHARYRALYSWLSLNSTICVRAPLAARRWLGAHKCHLPLFMWQPFTSESTRRWESSQSESNRIRGVVFSARLSILSKFRCHHQQNLPRNIFSQLASSMSSSVPGQTSTPSLNFKSIFDAALTDYKKKTGNELLHHPLATQLQRCDSVDAIVAIFQGQAEAFQQFQDGDQRLMKWIAPVVDVLYKFSGTFGAAAGIVRPRDPVRA